MNKIIKAIETRGKNKRMFIYLFESPDKSHFIVMGTKTLTDFNKRQILKTENVYSVETFVILEDMMTTLLEDSEVKNKILLREIKAMGEFTGKTDIGR